MAEEKRPLKIFTDGEYEWYTGYSLEEFKNYYCNEENIISEEEFDAQGWYELPESEWDEKCVKHETSGELISYREAMQFANGEPNFLICGVE
jgi:hypothetical protein